MSDTELQSSTATIESEGQEQTAGHERRRMTLNMGPQHPSTHGVLRVVLELDGETVITAKPDIGFLHTGIEKECEAKNWQQVVTLTDRVDYLANLSNNLVYALAIMVVPMYGLLYLASFLAETLGELHLYWVVPLASLGWE